jgi:hypothetical protein
VLISELIGDEPLAEGVIEITRDAWRRLLKPGARVIPGQARNNFYETNKINCLQDKHDVTL